MLITNKIKQIIAKSTRRPAVLLLAGPALVMVLGWATLASTAPAFAAPDPVNAVQQDVFSNQLCPALQKIKGEKLSKYCKDYAHQKDLDSAAKKICDKYGKKQLKSECQAYAAANNVSGSNICASDPSAQNNAVCSACANNNTAPGCPCSVHNACADNAANCSAGYCDLVKKYVNPTIDVASVSFGLIAAASLILGGINYAASEGDPQKAAQAKSRISKTIIAVVMYLFLYSFLQFIIPGGAFNR